MDTVYADHASLMLKMYGYAEAKRLITQDRDNNSPGTLTFAFYNATLKEIERLSQGGE
jgi:hypothetical protein